MKESSEGGDKGWLGSGGFLDEEEEGRERRRRRRRREFVRDVLVGKCFLWVWGFSFLSFALSFVGEGGEHHSY